LFCCFSLERRLKNLSRDQESLNSTVRVLNGAIIGAGASIAKLRTAAEEADRTLGTKVTSARALVEELSLLTSVCERLADRVEDTYVAAGPARHQPLRAVR